MSKEKSDKKDKKEKKEKRSEENGVKKDKKEKRSRKSDVTEQLENALEVQRPGSVDADGDDTMADASMMSVTESKSRAVIPKEALVPFANPLADDKQTKKVLKGVKKAAKNKTLKRGVKEVVKSLRKSPNNGPASSNVADPAGIVILAADISPMDVISHLPVLCEDHNIPYIYVTSRAELGAAGNTKRPTSVVMISRERTGKPGAKALEKTDDQKEFEEAYTDLLKTVRKAGASVKI